MSPKNYIFLLDHSFAKYYSLTHSLTDSLRQAKHVCNVATARKVTVGLLLVLCVPHAHSLVYSVPVQGLRAWTCWEDQHDDTGVILAAIVEFTCGYIVIVVVFVLNVVLVTLIRKQKLIFVTPAAGNVRAHRNRRLTRTLLLVAVVFLLCETPRVVMSFVNRFTFRTPTRRIILNWSYVLSGINHASNFFIYIVASPRFRLLLVKTYPFRLLHKPKLHILAEHEVNPTDRRCIQNQAFTLNVVQIPYEDTSTMLPRTPPPPPVLPDSSETT